MLGNFLVLTTEDVHTGHLILLGKHTCDLPNSRETIGDTTEISNYQQRLDRI